MKPGALIDDRFEIRDVAGTGGMATVYQAQDRVSGFVVALKVVQLRDTGTFDEEARLLRELTHPGIVRYVAHGRSAEGPYLVMEWLEGHDLEHRLARGPLGVDESVELVRHVAEALGEAHARGIVHRDIKPGNIWLEGGDLTRVKILDFGIARGSSEAATQAGLVAGTPAYMAPEQVRGATTVDAHADVYALGCVLFECLTGRPPFVADDVVALLAKTLLEDAPRLRTVMPDAPPRLDSLLGRALAKEPRRRPATAGLFASELACVTSPPSRSSMPPSRTLTAGEQRVTSVILFGVTQVADVTVSTGDWDDAIANARQVVEAFRARIEVMIGGSVAVVLEGHDSDQAGDVARQAASCALALRRVTKAGAMALVTGRTERGAVPIGDALDKAAALLRRSSAGIRVDDVTASLLGEDFDVGQGVLLGKRESDETRTLLGKRTPTFGRREELERIEAAFARCAQASRASAVIVSGAAGMGKSRVRREIVRALRARSERPEVWVARADPLGAGSAFALAAQLVRRAAGVQAGEPHGVTRDKLQRRVQRHVHADEVARVTRFLAELASAPSEADDDVTLATARREPTVMFDQIRSAWEDFVLAECGARPLVIVLDDLQWGDQPTVALLDSALRVSHGAPLFVVAFGRPEVTERFPGLWAERSPEHLALGDMTREGATALVAYALEGKATEEVTSRIVERAAGNAFYLEELVRAVADGRDETPDTALLIVQSRLERLAPEARRVLRAASVFGRTFWDAGVAVLVGDAREASEQLRELESREIVHRRSTSKFASAGELAFNHLLVQEAAHAMLVGDDKSLGHALAAEWLAHAGETDALVLAEHWELAKEPAQALVAWTHAAEQALEGNDYASCVERAERGVRCRARGDALAHLRDLQAEAHRWLGDNVAMAARAREATQLFARGTEAWVASASKLALAYQRLGHVTEVASLGEEIAASMVGGSAARISAAARTASVLALAGKREEAYRLLDVAIGAVRPETDPETLARLDQARANRALFEGRTAEYVERSISAANAFSLAGDRRLACVAQLNVGHGMLELGLNERAVGVLEATVADAERLGLRSIATMAAQNLGWAMFRIGDSVRARELLEASVTAFAQQGNRRLEGFSHVLIARIMLDHDAERARDSARRAVALAESALPLRIAALAVMAVIHARLGETAAAVAAAREAIAGLDAHGVEEGEGFVRLACAEALAASGVREEAAAAMRRARERVIQRADAIHHDEWRRSFLAVPEHAAVLSSAP